MRVDVERVLALLDELQTINSQKLTDIEWFEKGQPLSVPDKALKDWAFVGLSNATFIEVGAYKDSGVLPDGSDIRAD